ncbi:hypothetical protein BDV40DRAFT_261335 [Aspergillus tamarii]|uniref:Uncharacterized protein n=1 Tax=Aspergillus tamarii TaxID=41984 RepID=A0A5N6UZJ4_ASPTM|nr:hypothetical protein BDV40DRAFT_261335 [Aspergillus tamarii]
MVYILFMVFLSVVVPGLINVVTLIVGVILVRFIHGLFLRTVTGVITMVIIHYFIAWSFSENSKAATLFSTLCPVDVVRQAVSIIVPFSCIWLVDLAATSYIEAHST